jgi:transcriptional regulator with XRE-family HTH domain
MERYRCAGCGQELIHFGAGAIPSRCEDCIPQIGPGSPFLNQLSANLRRLRLGARMKTVAELCERAGLSATAYGSEDAGSEPNLGNALRLAFALGVSIDDLLDRIYWHPGQFATRDQDGQLRIPYEPLAGFFQVLPANVPIAGAGGPPVPVLGREKAAEVFGRNVRDARQRRHLTQATLARAAGLSKDAMTLIERGITETTTAHLFGLARALEVTPESLLDGMYWTPTAEVGLERADRALPRRISADKCRRPRRDQCQRRPTRSMPAAPEIEAMEATACEAATPGEVARRIGMNLRRHRQSTGLSLRQLGEATGIHFTHLARVERGRHLPQLNLLVKVAASINLRCGLAMAGVGWLPETCEFCLSADEAEKPSAQERMGLNARMIRRDLGVYQEAISARAAMSSRSDVAEIERGQRPFRLFTIVKLAGALEIDFADLFAGTVDWYVRPLPAPEYAPGESGPSKATQDAEMIQLWHEGRSLIEIGDALGLESSTIGSYICEMRDAGVHLPYRRPPRGNAELAARRRRGEDHREPLARRSPATDSARRSLQRRRR